MGQLKDDTPVFHHGISVYELKMILDTIPDEAFIIFNRFNPIDVEDVNQNKIGELDLTKFPAEYIAEE